MSVFPIVRELVFQKETTSTFKYVPDPDDAEDKASRPMRAAYIENWLFQHNPPPRLRITLDAIDESVAFASSPDRVIATLKQEGGTSKTAMFTFDPSLGCPPVIRKQYIEKIALGEGIPNELRVTLDAVR